MTTDLVVWLPLFLALLGGVTLVARKVEFNVAFRTQMYRLSPADLRDPAYAEALENMLTWQRVRNTRRSYMIVSATVVALAAGLVACPPFDQLAGKVIPPVVFDSLISVGAPSRMRLIFVWAVFFACVFHAAPVFEALEARSKPVGGNEDTVRKSGLYIDLILKCFAFQQFVLDRYIGGLLQFQPAGVNGKANGATKGGFGTISEMVRQEMALRMSASPGIQAAFDKLIMLGEVKPIRPIQDPLDQVMVLIRRYGIPYTRNLLRWHLDRKGKRSPWSCQIAGQLRGTSFSTGWVENVGWTPSGRHANSLLIRLPAEPGLAKAAADAHRQDLEIYLPSHGRSESEAFTCKITRTDIREESGNLWVAAVVQNQDLQRFSKCFSNSVV